MAKSVNDELAGLGFRHESRNPNSSNHEIIYMKGNVDIGNFHAADAVEAAKKYLRSIGESYN